MKKQFSRTGSRMILISCMIFLMTNVSKSQTFTNDAKLVELYQKSIDSILTKSKTVSADEAQKSLVDTLKKVGPNLIRASKKVLSPRDMYVQIKRATVITACAYLCPRCSNTHLSESSGYLIDSRGIMVTNYHVMAQYAFMKDGNKPVGFFARLSDGRTYGVKAILAASKKNDLAILQLETDGDVHLPALPLANSAKVGDHVYVLGHPKGMHYFFSQGNVTNKYFENAGDANNKFLREMMTISADYATGSSGGPVVDVCGNIVGTVSNTNMLMHSEQNPSVQMVVKNTVPVESLWKLILKGS